MKKVNGLLSGNQLKIIALIAMTCDHVGKVLFPDITWLIAIGRLSFPIFGYMIAEGCKFTKNRKRYLVTMFVLALLCQFVFFVAEGSLYQCVLVTFSLSIILIYIIDYTMKKHTLKSFGYLALGLTSVYFITEVLPVILKGTDFYVDYGFFGAMLPVFVFMADGGCKKIVSVSLALVLLSFSLNGIQWFSLFSIPLLAIYNGKKGKLNMKNLFYIYYPVHLAVIYFISNFIY